MIHPTAIIGKGTKIGKNCDVGPYCVIEDGVEIGENTKLWHNVYVAKGTTIGSSCRIHMGAVLGHEPQDTAFQGKPSYLKIGDGNIIREFVTIHRGTQEGSSTIIGNENFIMALCHIAHNCRLGDRIVMANNSMLAGHVQIEDMAFISGGCVVHQFVRIGKLVMASAAARIGKDVPPYMVVERDSVIASYNVVGLRRAGISEEARGQIKKAYQILYHSGLSVKTAIEKISSELNAPEIKYFVSFIRASNKRGICAYSSRRTTAVEYAPDEPQR